MAAYIHTGLFVRVEEMSDEGGHAPKPFPLRNGFSREWAYQVLGVVVVDSSGEYLLWLSNNQDMLFLISNRHLRTHMLDASKRECLRVPLKKAPADA